MSREKDNVGKVHSFYERKGSRQESERECRGIGGSHAGGKNANEEAHQPSRAKSCIYIYTYIYIYIYTMLRYATVNYSIV